MDAFDFDFNKYDSLDCRSIYGMGAEMLKPIGWDPELDELVNERGIYSNEINEILERNEVWHSDSQSSGVKPQSAVILHDRLFSDTVLSGNTQNEHSYCTRLFSNSSGDDDSLDSNSSSTFLQFQSEIEEELARELPTLIQSESLLGVKDEPMSDSCYCSAPSSGRGSPFSTTSSTTSTTPTAKGQRKRAVKRKAPTKQAVKRSRNGLQTRQSQQSSRLIMPHEPNLTGFTLPPTPPSSNVSDNETGNVSPERTSSSPTARLFQSTSSTSVTRQPIQTTLISVQPKGSIGVLVLTEEEKKTLREEGYPIPTRLPLSKAEEKALKKVRRKIKNKISAQESRRKKKEHVEKLERDIVVLSVENEEFKKRIVCLEDTNSNLSSQLKKMQQLLGIQTLSISSAFNDHSVSKSHK